MLPIYKNKQVIIVSPLVRPKVGSVVVAVQNGREVLKRVKSINGNLMVELRGDNEKQSTDSRTLGKVHLHKVLATVVWPKK